MRALTLIFAGLMLCETASAAALRAYSLNQPDRKICASSEDKKHDIKQSTQKRVSLAKLAREALAVHFGDSQYKTAQELIEATPVAAEYKIPAGLFVTLSKNGKTRACWGSVYPTNQDLIRATVETTENALTKEYRYARIGANEYASLKAQVTVIRGLQPINGLSGQNAMQFGMFVRQGSRGAVILPGEVSDAHYQLIKCKLKAGIPVNQPCQIYRIRADVLK